MRPTHRFGQTRRALPAILLAAALGAGLAGCARGNDGPTPTKTAAAAHASPAEHEQATRARVAAGPGHAHDPGHAHGEPIGAASDFSLYHLDAPWTDQNGEERRLASLAGRVQVVAMVYTTCAHACPRILADMKRIEASLPEASRDHVGFVIVTIDPERDTPEQLARYASDVRLDPARWTLLTAPDNTVLELAVLLGVEYRRISETDFSHTNVITVLDQAGEIAHRQLGLGAEPDTTLARIDRLLTR